MARLRQLNPNNYASSGNIHADFENIVRYLIASERGTKTLNEMLSAIFDEEGNFSGAFELRRDQSEGIQYRVGTYSNSEEGWITIIPLSDLRGNSGVNVGLVSLPIITGRVDYLGDGSETEFPYTFDSTDTVLVFVNGLLQRAGALYDYTLSSDLVTFTSAPSGGDEVTFFKVRGDESISSTRVDVTPISTQTVFGFVFPTTPYELYIYKNGILQSEGGTKDYVLSPSTSTITFLSPVLDSDTVTFLTVESTSGTVVTGLMTESEYVDGSTGQILWSKISVNDGDIPQGKVSSLSSDLAARAHLSVGSLPPAAPSSGHLWLDTSAAPNVLKFHDGVGWIATSPENALPVFTAVNALQYLRVNSSGSGLEFGNLDLSGLIPATQKGAANGVATLDGSGRMPEAQMPTVRATDNIYFFLEGPVSNGNHIITRSYKQLIRITGISALLTSGSCQIQLLVSGTPVGPTYAVSSTPLDQPLATLVEIDTLSASKPIGIVVSSGSSPQDLNVTLTTELLE